MLLLKLMKNRKDLADSTKLQYLRWYPVILRDKGIEPPPDTFIYNQMVSAIKKRMHDPAGRKARRSQRHAYSVESLKMTSHAFYKMSERGGGSWHDLRAQAMHALSTICFWAVCRMSDVTGAKIDEYSTKTTLLEQDLKLMEEDGEVVGLEIQFNSEKIAKDFGSTVQLPMVAAGSLTSICPVRAYMAYQKMKEPLQQEPFAPWLVDYDGKPIIQSRVAKLINQAVSKTFAGTLDEETFARLKTHSFRAALPSELHRLGSQLTIEQRQMMGRWLSRASYDRYVKNNPKNRFQVARKVLEEIENNIL